MALVNVLVTSNVQSFHTERRFARDLTVRDLKNKLELLTGASAATMRLELKDNQGRLVKQLGDNHATLDLCDVLDGMTIHVVDTPANSVQMDMSEGVAKFELTSEEYAKRSDSVRAWKEKNKFGEFDPESHKRKEDKEKDIIDQSVVLAHNYHPGQRCEVTIAGQPTKRGAIVFVGQTHFKPGSWIGVRYDEPVGKNDGSVEGKRYFDCPPNYGAFARPQNVHVGDFPEQDIMDEI